MVQALPTSSLKRDILAFVHIEKAAGTTLIHVLRRNYFLRYFDVRPMGRGDARVFSSDDMDKVLLFNPFVKCIAGHSVVPYGDLDTGYPNIRYVTVLRDPVMRYVSQFQYLTHERAHGFTFEEFLEDRHYDNFQTRKIAGAEDVSEAKKMLSEKFLLVGVVEEFDEFLLMLARKLVGVRFNPAYREKNKARRKGFSEEIVSKYRDQIMERNQCDIELYDYVRNTLLPENRAWYGDSLQSDLAAFRSRARLNASMNMKTMIDYGVRKIYVEPVSGLVRRINGRPAKGSY